MGKIRDSISANIAKYRKEKGISQKELAEMVGAKNLTTVSSWERGASSPDIETLFLMCDIFGVSINQMYGIGITSNPCFSADTQEVATAYENADFETKNNIRFFLKLPVLVDEKGMKKNLKTS